MALRVCNIIGHAGCVVAATSNAFGTVAHVFNLAERLRALLFIDDDGIALAETTPSMA
jgi:hypothetical protein